MKPKKNSKDQIVMTIIFGIILYLLGGLLVCHGVVLYAEEPELSYVINNVVDHATTNPFNMFPLNPKALLIYTGIFAFAAFWVWIESDKKKNTRPGEEHGSAKWESDMKKYNEKYSEKDTLKTAIMTDEVSLTMNTRKSMRNLNILVTGGSGAGKSRFVVKPNLLQANCSYVVTDPSGELLETCGSFLESQGYKVKVFNLVQMAHSCSYNPFNYIRNEEGVITMINALISNTTPKGASKGDPFWEKSETALLQAISFYLYYECPPEDRNFSNVMKLLLLAEVKEDEEDFQSTLDIMFEQLKEKNPQHIAVRQYQIFKMGAGKTLKSILISCSVRLTAFNLDVIKRLTNTDNIDLGKIGDEKTALFCITPVADTSFNYLVALMYTQLFETLYFHAENEVPGKRLNYHVRFLLDEFANIGTIPDFEQKLATMRKYEISCTIILQNLAQIKTMYKDSWESITGNCDSFLFLGGQEQTTLEYVSKKLGKETISTKSTGRTHGKSGSSSQNFSLMGRELLTADEIAKLPNDMCIYFLRGLNPFLSKKYNYPRHPNYKYTADANKDLIFRVTDHFDLSVAPSKPKPEKSIEDKNMEKLQNMANSAEMLNVIKGLANNQEFNNMPMRQTSAKGIEFFTSDVDESNIDETLDYIEDISKICNSYTLISGFDPSDELNPSSDSGILDSNSYMYDDEPPEEEIEYVPENMDFEDDLDEEDDNYNSGFHFE